MLGGQRVVEPLLAHRGPLAQLLDTGERQLCVFQGGFGPEAVDCYRRAAEAYRQLLKEVLDV